MKENKGKTITIVILIILLLGAISYICYDKFLTKDETNKVETKTDPINKEELIKQISFKLEDIECTGTETCEKKVKLSYNNKNHEIKLIKKLNNDNSKYLIEVYEDNKLIDTLDGGDYQDYWGDGTKPQELIKNMDGYIYVIDSKYLGIVYRNEGPKPSWDLKFYNGNRPSQEQPIPVAAYGTSMKSDSYENGRDLFVLEALEFDGHNIKYWNTYCGNDKKPASKDNIVIAQYNLTYDGTKVTQTTGKILTDAEGGGQESPCPTKKQ